MIGHSAQGVAKQTKRRRGVPVGREQGARRRKWAVQGRFGGARGAAKRGDGWGWDEIIIRIMFAVSRGNAETPKQLGGGREDERGKLRSTRPWPRFGYVMDSLFPLVGSALRVKCVEKGATTPLAPQTVKAHLGRRGWMAFCRLSAQPKRCCGVSYVCAFGTWTSAIVRQFMIRKHCAATRPTSRSTQRNEKGTTAHGHRAYHGNGIPSSSTSLDWAYS